MFAFRKLEVWQLAKEICLKVYGITKGFPPDEKFCLTAQMNKAAISVVSNIAEGSARRSFKEQAYFSEISYGSLMEITCQMEIARELGYLNEHDWDSISGDLEKLACMLSSLRNSQLGRYNKT